jgi:soluble lytic murein transglycosylase-like protein
MDVVKQALALTGVLLFAPLASTAATTASPIYCGTKQWQTFIDEAAARFDLPARYLHAVMATESAGCESMNEHPTTSVAGAKGLMQLMPVTWERFRRRLNLGADGYDPHDNVLAGAAYLRELVDRYGWPAASAAYHAGPARYDEYLANGRALPRATLDYLARINRTLAQVSTESRAPVSGFASPTDSNRELFVGRKPSDSTADAELDRTPTDGLFVSLLHAKHREERKPAESSNVQQK